MKLFKFAELLSTRPKNVILKLSIEGISYSRKGVYITERPNPNCELEDAFENLTFTRLRNLPACGEKSAHEIVKQLAKQGIYLKDTSS